MVVLALTTACLCLAALAVLLPVVSAEENALTGAVLLAFAREASWPALLTET